jgi:hypothetical protein
MSDKITLDLGDARRLFDLAVDTPLLCSGSFETDDVVVLRRLAATIGVDPARATPDEFAAQFPHPFARRSVRAEPMATGEWLKGGRILAEHEHGARWNGRMETVEEQRARMAEERADKTCQAGPYGRQCARPESDLIHGAETGEAAEVEAAPLGLKP